MKLFAKIFFTTFLIPLIVVVPLQSIFSRTSEEIGQEIEQQKQRLDETSQQIELLNQQITELQEQAENVEDGIPQVQTQLEITQLELDRNRQELSKLTEENTLKELEKKQRVALQNDSVKDIYLNWRSRGNVLEVAGLTNSRIDIQALDIYSNYSLGQGQDGIDDLVGEINVLNQQINESNEQILALNNETILLEQRQIELQNLLAYYQNTTNQNASTVATLIDQQAQIQKDINNLLEEQKAAAEREARLLEEQRRRVREEVVDGDFIVAGTGRDLYQGHSVGMSQWGAYGGAQSGMTAEEILTFYYTNVTIEQREGNIDVIGYGLMDNDTYVAGLGEIPSKACAANQNIIDDWTDYADDEGWDDDDPRRFKYVIDNPDTFWDCWPEESIKAQVIAARSYGMSNPGAICVTAACQVYDGHTEKMWAAMETENLVIISQGETHTGQIIRALYSADNSQGSGTANNDTMFQSINGTGTPFSYLRAVNDTGFAQTWDWTYWQYDTNGYTMDEVMQMIEFGTESNLYREDVKAYLSNVVTEVGALQELSFERDPSGRVKIVWFFGENGSQVAVGGWWFKNIWNNWVHDNETYDYIYSQTFYLNTV